MNLHITFQLIQPLFEYVYRDSALGYVAPANKLLGRDKQIFAERDQKLVAAREQRRINRQAAAEENALAG